MASNFLHALTVLATVVFQTLNGFVPSCCALMLNIHIVPSCCARMLCPRVAHVCCALMLRMHVVPSCCACMLCPHVAHACCALMLRMHVVPSCALMLCPHVVHACCACTLCLWNLTQITPHKTGGGPLERVQIFILAEGLQIEFLALSGSESRVVQTFCESCVHLD